MKKVQCKEGLDVYKKFLTRMTRISEFLKVAEVSGAADDAPRSDRTDRNPDVSVLLQQVGIDRGDIPDLSQVSPNTDAAQTSWASLPSAASVTETGVQHLSFSVEASPPKHG